jgi:hypothetical protein
VYGAFETLLKPLLEFQDLKPEVFQLLREVGNCLALLRELSDVVDVQQALEAVQVRTHRLPQTPTRH